MRLETQVWFPTEHLGREGWQGDLVVEVVRMDEPPRPRPTRAVRTGRDWWGARAQLHLEMGQEQLSTERSPPLWAALLWGGRIPWVRRLPLVQHSLPSLETPRLFSLLGGSSKDLPPPGRPGPPPP